MEIKVGQRYITSYGRTITITSILEDRIYYAGGSLYIPNSYISEQVLLYDMFKFLIKNSTLMLDTPAARLLYVKN